MLILFDKLINKIRQSFRKHCFRKYTRTKHREFTLIGKPNLFNKNVIIGKGVVIYPDVTFWGDGDIIIGDNSAIGQGTIIYSSKINGGLIIGQGTHISAYCYIIDMDHGFRLNAPISQQENSYDKIFIGKDVWIAAGCEILKGSTIEDGAVIGAGAVVKGKIPKNAVAVGVPAKVIKYRQ